MNAIERRIEALENRLNMTGPELPRIVVALAHGGAGNGGGHYAWAKDDLSDLIEREAGETLEAFGERAGKLAFAAPQKGFTPAYNLAPRLDKWGQGEKTATLFDRLGVVPFRAREQAGPM